MMRIQGILHPNNSGSVNTDTRSNILDAVFNNGLLLLANDAGLWAHGIVSIDTCIPASGQKFALEFLSNIKGLISAEGVERLGLKGCFVITGDSDAEPVNIRATVGNGEVRYQQATLTWDKEEVLS